MHAHLQVYKVRFRVWDISQTFFSIISTLKSFISVPSIFSRQQNDDTNEISSTEALALTVEAGLLLDRMIDISVEEKGLPIPDEWIDEFERIEQMIGRITQEDNEPETPSPNPIEWSESTMESPDVSVKRETSSIADSLFSMSPRSDRLEDSMSSIGDHLPAHLRVKHEEDIGLAVENDVEGLSEDARGSSGDGDSDQKWRREEGRVFEKNTFKRYRDDDVRDFSEDERDSEEEEFNLEKELKRDDERVFEKEYHAISTPPELEVGEVDNSPFLARVIAELEELDPFESLPTQICEQGAMSENSDENENTGIQQNRMMINDDEVNIDALYEAMINSDDSDDEHQFESSRMRGEIRTSSPNFDDQELHYEELESSDDDENEDDTTRFDRTIILDTLDDPTQNINPINLEPFENPKRIKLTTSDTLESPIRLNNTNLDSFESPTHPNHTLDAFESPIGSNHMSLDALDSPSKHSNSDLDLDETITLPRSPRKHPILSRTPSPPPTIPPQETPTSLRDSQLHSKVTQIAHSHPTIALIPQTSTFRPTQTSEYGYYTLRPQASHSRHSSVSSDAPEPRRVDVGGVNLYVRILSDRVMVRVGGGWVDLEQYLKEYVGKREYRRRSGSVTSSPGIGEYEVLDLDDQLKGRMGSTPPSLGMRAASSLGTYSSPPRGSGRVSALEFRSVSPAAAGGFEDAHGSIGRAGGTRRVYVRRK